MGGWVGGLVGLWVCGLRCVVCGWCVGGWVEGWVVWCVGVRVCVCRFRIVPVADCVVLKAQSGGECGWSGLLDFHTFSKKTNRASIRDVPLSSTAQHDDQLTRQHKEHREQLSPSGSCVEDLVAILVQDLCFGKCDVSSGIETW